MAKATPTKAESQDNVRDFAKKQGKSMLDMPDETGDATLSEDEALDEVEITETRRGQKIITGMGPKKDRKIENRARTYLDKREVWQDALKEFTAAKEDLMQIMHEKELPEYVCDEFTVTITSTKENVKVKAAKSADEGESE